MATPSAAAEVTRSSSVHLGGVDEKGRAGSCPLFAAAWHGGAGGVVLGGGGGTGDHGVKNKLALCTFDAGNVLRAASEVSLGEALPLALACGEGGALACGTVLEKRGEPRAEAVRVVDVGAKAGLALAAKGAAVAVQAVSAGLACMGQGGVVAAVAEEGEGVVSVGEFPGMGGAQTVATGVKAVRGLALSPQLAGGGDKKRAAIDRLVAVVGRDGSCSVWSTTSGKCVEQLEPEAKGARYRGCGFVLGSEGMVKLVVGVNACLRRPASRASGWASATARAASRCCGRAPTGWATRSSAAPSRTSWASRA